MRKTLLFLYLLSLGSIAAYGQTRLTQDPKLERQLHESGLIHQPLPLDIENSFETNGWKKEVLQSAPLTRSAGTEGWSHSGAGSMSFSTEKTVSGKGSIKLQFPTFTGKRATGSPSDPDYATYGNSSVTYHLDGANLEKYNRIVFSIYPDCDGARIVNMNLTFRNADTPAKKGYNQPSGSHLINLINRVEPMLPRNRRVSARQGDVHHLQHSPQRQRPDYRRFSYLLPGQSTTANGESP